MQSSAQIISSYGYSTHGELSCNRRFFTTKVSVQDISLVLKEVSPYAMPNETEALNRRLDNQIWFYRLLNGLEDLKSHARCPEIHHEGTFDDGRRYYISEYFDRPYFPELEGSVINLPRLDKQRFNAAIPAMAEMFYSLDKAFSGTRLSRQAPPPLTHRIDRWLADNLGLSDDVPRDLIERAKGYIASQQHRVQPLLQHGDLPPQHLFRLPVDIDPNAEPGEYPTPLGIIDSETASFNRERGYDVAEMFARIYTLAGYREEACLFLRSFMAFLDDEDTFLAGFHPVLTLRAVGMTVDAHRHHRELGIDYRARAKELVERCLTEDIRNIVYS